MGSTPGSGRSPGEGNGNPLQCSCLENPRDGGAWWAAVYGVTQSRTRLSDFTFTFHFHALEKKWQPTPVFLPGESRGQESLVGNYRAWADSPGAAAAAVTGLEPELCTKRSTGRRSPSTEPRGPPPRQLQERLRGKKTRHSQDKYIQLF